MVIHVVRQGESVYSVAGEYGVGTQRLIWDNGLRENDSLVVGQTLVLRFPEQVHTVREGETLFGIATAYGVAVNTLLRNNPVLLTTDYLHTGQTLVIRFDDIKRGPAAVNAYAYPFIDRQDLRRQLPYLTYLCLFSYGFTETGDLIGIEGEDELIRLSYEFSTAPLLVFTAMTPQGTFSSELGARLFHDAGLQNKIIDALARAVENKGYYGVDVDFEFVGAENRDGYTNFVARLRQRLMQMGKVVFVTLAPKTYTDQPGDLYEGHDYGGLGAAAGRALLMTYEWGYTYGPPMAVAPLPSVRTVVDYAITQIPADKLMLGIPNYGYDWPLPYERGFTRAVTIGNMQAVDIARQYGSDILYDETSQAPYFYYRDIQNREHVVWFEDARSIHAKSLLVQEYGLYGMGIWQITRLYQQKYMVMNALYDIVKLF